MLLLNPSLTQRLALFSIVIGMMGIITGLHQAWTDPDPHGWRLRWGYFAQVLPSLLSTLNWKLKPGT